MIGIFDSGVGGLGLLHSLRKQFPGQDFIYMADQAHVPYGSKDRETLQKLICSCLGFMEQKGAQTIVLGCNTASASGAREVYRGKADVIGIIGKTCDLVDPQASRVLILSTPFTAQSHSYRDELQKRYPGMQVEEKGLTCLAFMIEHGCPAQEVHAYLNGEIGHYRHQFDQAVLACTHFPFATKQFEEVLDIPLINSEGIRIPQPQTEGSGQCSFYTTGDPELMKKQIHDLLGWDVECHHAETKEQG